MSEHGGSRTIGAVETELDILDHLIDSGEAGVTEIADALGLTKATVHAHLQTLQQRRYVVNEDGTYSLGLRFLTVGRTALSDHELYGVGKSTVDRLAETTGGSAQIGVEQNGLGYYLYRTCGPDAVRTPLVTNSEMHLHATAFGKAVLAHYPEEEVEAIIERHGLPELTERTITTRERLFDELERIQDQGVAFDEGEHVREIRCVAAPIRGGDGGVVGAISVSGSQQRMHGKSLRNEMLGTVAEAARSIEADLTGPSGGDRT